MVAAKVVVLGTVVIVVEGSDASSGSGGIIVNIYSGHESDRNFD